MDDIKNVVRIEKNRVIKDYSVGIYARVSTNSKEQLDSLANQISGLTRLAAAHRTWFVADIFIDVGTAKTGSIREQFNRMIRERENIRIGLKQRAANGMSGLYGRPCYGYYKDKNGMLAINEKKAEVVRNIVDWYLEGASAVGIKKQLESKQIKSPRGKDTWSKHTIESILTNMKYNGDVAIADSGGSGNQYKLGDHHTGIISKEKFEAVQIERAMRSNMEITEDGLKRSSTKYSSKRKK